MNSHPRHAPKQRHTAPHSGKHWPHPGDGVLDRLPPQEQEVMILSHFYGLAKDEIAAIIGASVDMVDTLLSHAVEHMRRRLAGQQAA